MLDEAIIEGGLKRVAAHALHDHEGGQTGLHMVLIRVVKLALEHLPLPEQEVVVWEHCRTVRVYHRLA